jgi:hypothetical protein
MNHESCHSLSTLSKWNDCNSVTSYDIDSKSLEDSELICQVDATFMHLGVRHLLWSKFLVRLMITCNIVRTTFLRMNPSPLF